MVFTSKFTGKWGGTYKSKTQNFTSYSCSLCCENCRKQSNMRPKNEIDIALLDSFKKYYHLWTNQEISIFYINLGPCLARKQGEENLSPSTIIVSSRKILCRFNLSKTRLNMSHIHFQYIELSRWIIMNQCNIKIIINSSSWYLHKFILKIGTICN